MSSSFSCINWFARREIRLFLSYASAFGCLGMVVASLGPIIPEISRRTSTSVSETSLLISVRGISYAFGSSLGGPLFDKYDANRILSIALSLCALGTGAVSFVYNIWGIGALVCFQGLCMGLLDTGGNVCVLWLFSEEKSEPYLQSLHFVFAVGALIGPLIVGSVMDAFKNNFDIGLYVIAAIFTPVIISIALQDSPKIKSTRTEESKALTLYEKIFGSFTRDEKFVITVSAIFLGIYVGAEVSIGSLVYTYAIERGLTEQTGYLLSSVFWALIAAGRLIAIPLSTRLNPQKMLLINIVGCMISSFMLLLFDVNVLNIGPNQTSVTLWIGVPFFGLFMASCFPTVFTLAEEMMPMTGKAASFFVVGSSIGEMAVPALVSSLFVTPVGYTSLVIVVFTCTVIMFLAWLGIVLQKRSMFRRGILTNKKIHNVEEDEEGIYLVSKK